jgi:hypothetical protein
MSSDSRKNKVNLNEEGEEEDYENPRIGHTEGTAALDKALHHLECCNNVSSFVTY